MDARPHPPPKQILPAFCVQQLCCLKIVDATHRHLLPVMLNRSSRLAPCRLFLAVQRGLAHFQSQAQKYDAASIVISDCNNPNVNLAMEQHLFKTAPLRNSHTLMIWRNNPTVVIGRNKNQWAECDLKVFRIETQTQCVPLT